MNLTNYTIKYKEKQDTELKFIKEKSKEIAFIQRKRKIDDNESLMHIMMQKVIKKISFPQLQKAVKMEYAVEISENALKKKFQNYEPIKQLFEKITTKRVPNKLPKIKKNMLSKNMILLDCTSLAQEGTSNTVYRLHTSYSLFEHKILQTKVTDNHIAESTLHFDIVENGIYLADRAYAKTAQMLHIMNHNADFIMRYSPNLSSIYDVNDSNKKINLLDNLLAVKPIQKTFSMVALIKDKQKDNQQIAKVRIIALRKNKEQIEKSEKRVRRNAMKVQSILKQETLELNHWIIVITSFIDNFSNKKILQAYRLRWQIELHFKRFKTFLNIHKLQKSSKNYALTFIFLLLIYWCLIEDVLNFVINSQSDTATLCDFFSICHTPSYYHFSLWKTFSFVFLFISDNSFS